MSKGMSDKERRTRRRRRRLQAIVIYVAIAVGLAWFFESQATTTIIFVRHAEKATTPADNPGLSEAGNRRVAELTRHGLLFELNFVPDWNHGTRRGVQLILWVNFS